MRSQVFFCSLALSVPLSMNVGPLAWGQNYIPANDRLMLVSPPSEMQVATGNDVELRVNNDAVLRVIVRWKSLDGGQAPEGALEERQQIMTFGPDGQGVIEVHPPTLGTSAMTVEVDFQDARYAVATTVMNINLPKRKPKTFALSEASDERITILHLDLGEHKAARLKGIATYSDYRFPVDVDAAKLKFAAEPAQSAIELDPATGIVIARAYGTAMIRAKLGGHESDVCVVVSKNAQDVRATGCSR